MAYFLQNKKNWFINNKIAIESDNIDEIFNQISKNIDSDDITNETTEKKNKKIQFTKEQYKKILQSYSSKNNKGDDLKIKYKSE